VYTALQVVLYRGDGCKMETDIVWWRTNKGLCVFDAVMPE